MNALWIMIKQLSDFCKILASLKVERTVFLKTLFFCGCFTVFWALIAHNYVFFRRSGLLSMSQQLPISSQQQPQQQSQRGVIGQLPAMQGHSSPSHSPGLNVSNKLQVSQPSRSTILPTPSSNLLPNSSLANSTSLPGFVGGLPMRSNSHFGQVNN